MLTSTGQAGNAAQRSIRLLDLGCGTGSLVRRLAQALPDATLTGIDLSVANVEIARRSADDAASRIGFHVADYLHFAAEPFDVIVSDGVLHLMSVDTATLAAKLARDLRPDGVLVCDMPYACPYNTLFAAVRRGLRRIRAPWLDRVILRIARLLHGREMDDARLQERVGYMYFPPQRVMDARFLRAFAAAGLRRRVDYAVTSTSLSQLRHRVTVFVRDAAG